MKKKCFKSFIEWPEIIEDSLCSSVHSSETEMEKLEENSESIEKWKKYTKLKCGTQKHFILKWMKRKHYKRLADCMRCWGMFLQTLNWSLFAKIISATVFSAFLWHSSFDDCNNLFVFFFICRAQARFYFTVFVTEFNKKTNQWMDIIIEVQYQSQSLLYTYCWMIQQKFNWMKWPANRCHSALLLFACNACDNISNMGIWIMSV